MSIGALGGTAASVAGSALAQAKGSDVERAGQDTISQARQDRSSQRAESAAGIGQTDEDQGATDRDADGRRLWEQTPEGESSSSSPNEPDLQARRSKDATGQTGILLDLTG